MDRHWRGGPVPPSASRRRLDRRRGRHSLHRHHWSLPKPARSDVIRQFTPKQVGELCHAEALFHRQASEQSLTRPGVCRHVSRNGKRCVRLNQRSVGELITALAEARNPSWRGGNLRRQFGDVPCLRQGKYRTTTAVAKTKAGRRRRCRLWLQLFALCLLAANTAASKGNAADTASKEEAFAPHELAHDPEKCAAVFPRDKRGTRLRGDHAPTIG